MSKPTQVDPWSCFLLLPCVFWTKDAWGCWSYRFFNQKQIIVQWKLLAVPTQTEPSNPTGQEIRKNCTLNGTQRETCLFTYVKDTLLMRPLRHPIFCQVIRHLYRATHVSFRTESVSPGWLRQTIKWQGDKSNELKEKKKLIQSSHEGFVHKITPFWSLVQLFFPIKFI